MVVLSWHVARKRQKQDDHKLEASLGYLGGPVAKTK